MYKRQGLIGIADGGSLVEPGDGADGAEGGDAADRLAEVGFGQAECGDEVGAEGDGGEGHGGELLGVSC